MILFCIESCFSTEMRERKKERETGARRDRHTETKIDTEMQSKTDTDRHKKVRVKERQIDKQR